MYEHNVVVGLFKLQLAIYPHDGDLIKRRRRISSKTSYVYSSICIEHTIKGILNSSFSGSPSVSPATMHWQEASYEVVPSLLESNMTSTSPAATYETPPFIGF